MGANAPKIYVYYCHTYFALRSIFAWVIYVFGRGSRVPVPFRRKIAPAGCDSTHGLACGMVGSPASSPAWVALPNGNTFTPCGIARTGAGSLGSPWSHCGLFMVNAMIRPKSAKVERVYLRFKAFSQCPLINHS